LCEYETKNALRFQVPAPSGEVTDNLERFETCLKKASEPNRGKVDVLKKNEARAALVKDIRTYVQGFLAKNPNVTNADREEMGIPIYDTTPIFFRNNLHINTLISCFFPMGNDLVTSCSAS
jgi:hypothetical protein